MMDGVPKAYADPKPRNRPRKYTSASKTVESVREIFSHQLDRSGDTLDQVLFLMRGFQKSQEMIVVTFKSVRDALESHDARFLAYDARLRRLGRQANHNARVLNSNFDLSRSPLKTGRYMSGRP
jgi:hypothetical protein